MARGGPALDVTADLSIEVDGLPVRIDGRRGQVRIQTADVDRLLIRLREAARATGVASPRAHGARWADTLADGGLTAVLESPSGRVATLGAAADSATGALLWGSRHIALEPLGVLRASGTIRALAAALVGTALAVVLARRVVGRS